MLKIMIVIITIVIIMMMIIMIVLMITIMIIIITSGFKTIKTIKIKNNNISVTNRYLQRHININKSIKQNSKYK